MDSHWHRLQLLEQDERIAKCRGDGITTCRICNYDFNQKTKRPEPIQFCNDCEKVRCQILTVMLLI